MTRKKKESKVAHRVLELNHFNLELKIATEEEIKNTKKQTKTHLPQFITKLFGIKKARKGVIKENKVNVYDKSLLDYPTGFFKGYFQTEKYFKNIREQLLKEFSLKDELNEANKQMLEEIRQKENAVSIHVRRGDYVNLSDIHFLCGLDYYQKAIDRISANVTNPHFYLFSDDIKYVQENLKIDFPYTIVDINSADEGYFDLELMKNCKHNIIANSTFSWWGAWLNQNPNKIVIAPQKWHKDSQNGEWDIIPEDWTVIN